MIYQIEHSWVLESKLYTIFNSIIAGIIILIVCTLFIYYALIVHIYFVHLNKSYSAI